MEDFIVKGAWIILGISIAWIIIRFTLVFTLVIIEKVITTLLPWYKDQIELFFIKLCNFVCTLRWKTNLED